MDWCAFSFALALCAIMAVLEGVLSGKNLTRWLASLKRPKLYAPLSIWIIAAIVAYAIQGLIAYRLFSRPAIVPLDALAIGLLIAVMLFNIAYNVILDRKRNPRFAYVGLLWFLPLLAVLQIVLHLTDPLGAILNLAYVAWVVGYDLPVMRALWKLNS